MPIIKENISRVISEGLTTTTGDKILFAKIPYYLNIWFYITLASILLVVCIIIWLWINIWARNRLVVRIIMPDKTLNAHAYKKFTGNKFPILGKEIDANGKPIIQEYEFDSTCVYTGRWGKYIDYDYGIMKPRMLPGGLPNYKNDTQFFEFISGLLNTDLAIDLLLSSKFKDFVKIMLIIILVATIISIGIGIFIIIKQYSPVIQQCTLLHDNATMSVIKDAMMLR